MVFSIIIPVYQVEQYIHKCVDSVLTQEFTDLEIILVDDGSPDRCGVICDSYAVQDSRVRVIHKENGGLSDARNTGVLAAKGEYLIFLDSDDYIGVDTCKKLYPFTQLGCDIIVGDGICEGASNQLTHDFECSERSGLEFLKIAMSEGSMPMAACLYVFRRSFLLENQLYFKPRILHEDEHFTPRAFLQAERVINSHVCFYHYVIRGDSITRKDDLRKNAKDFLATISELRLIYQKIPDDDLKSKLLDSLAEKYLSLFQRGRLYQWGIAYCPKGELMHLAHRPKTWLKVLLFAFSPRLYWYVNYCSKFIKNK